MRDEKRLNAVVEKKKKSSFLCMRLSMEEEGHELVVDVGLVGREGDKDDALDAAAVGGVLEPAADGAERDARGFVDGVAVDARRDGAHGDALQAVLEH